MRVSAVQLSGSKSPARRERRDTGHGFLTRSDEYHRMLRVMAILLALGVGLDHYALGGKYRHTAERLAYLLFHRM
jgi:hypothetical protein